MAIDTRMKRVSMMNFGDGAITHLVFQADGVVDADDRIMLLGLYGGLFGSGISGVPSPIRKRYILPDGRDIYATQAEVDEYLREYIAARTREAERQVARETAKSVKPKAKKAKRAEPKIEAREISYIPASLIIDVDDADRRALELAALQYHIERMEEEEVIQVLLLTM